MKEEEGGENKRPLPCFNMVPLYMSCRLTVGANRAFTKTKQNEKKKKVETQLLVTTCFTFSSL